MRGKSTPKAGLSQVAITSSHNVTHSNSHSAWVALQRTIPTLQATNKSVQKGKKDKSERGAVKQLCQENALQLRKAQLSSSRNASLINTSRQVLNIVKWNKVLASQVLSQVVIKLNDHLNDDLPKTRRQVLVSVQVMQGLGILSKQRQNVRFGPKRGSKNRKEQRLRAQIQEKQAKVCQLKLIHQTLQKKLQMLELLQKRNLRHSPLKNIFRFPLLCITARGIRIHLNKEQGFAHIQAREELQLKGDVDVGVTLFDWLEQGMESAHK